jgi:DNA mismatch endonuclease (patch repair protein)
LRRETDIAFPRARIAVDVRGCWWHGCAAHSTTSRTNTGWWEAKIDANRTRDRDSEQRLAAAGWTVIVVWEHDDPGTAAQSILKALRGPGQRSLSLGASASRI